ncbi:hypothetical protein ACFL2K_01185 [Candidatus Margulisiibacteriota bacterium]
MKNKNLTLEIIALGLMLFLSVNVYAEQISPMIYDDGINVGIGTISPNKKLVVEKNGSSGPRLRLQNNISNNSELQFFGLNGVVGQIYTDAAGNGGSDFNITATKSDANLIFRVSNYEGLRINAAENVKIGTKLVIEHNSSSGPRLRLQNNISNNSELQFFGLNGVVGQIYTDAAGKGGSDFNIIATKSDANLIFRVANYEGLKINSVGNVSIGTPNPKPGYKLTVNGGIYAESIRVRNDVAVNTITLHPQTWSDFVFEDDYNLMPLAEVENKIKEQKHLPGIPSEAEVKKNGVSVGEMQAKLLQKIEELTLYVIEQNKKINIQAEEIKELKTIVHSEKVVLLSN